MVSFLELLAVCLNLEELAAFQNKDMANEMIKTYRTLNYKQMGERREVGGEFARDLSPRNVDSFGFFSIIQKMII